MLDSKETIPPYKTTYQKAWVIFSDDTDLFYLKFLKRGFRHCFLILNDGSNWIAMDPLANRTEITVPKAAADFDLPRWLQTQGYTVQPAPIKPVKKPAPITVFSCVESVKRVLGIRKSMMFTPWQLYRYLRHISETHPSQTKGELSWEV